MRISLPDDCWDVNMVMAEEACWKAVEKPEDLSNTSAQVQYVV